MANKKTNKKVTKMCGTSAKNKWGKFVGGLLWDGGEK